MVYPVSCLICCKGGSCLKSYDKWITFTEHSLLFPHVSWQSLVKVSVINVCATLGLPAPASWNFQFISPNWYGHLFCIVTRGSGQPDAYFQQLTDTSEFFRSFTKGSLKIANRTAIYLSYLVCFKSRLIQFQCTNLRRNSWIQCRIVFAYLLEIADYRTFRLKLLVEAQEFQTHRYVISLPLRLVHLKLIVMGKVK